MTGPEARGAVVTQDALVVVGADGHIVRLDEPAARWLGAGAVGLALGTLVDSLTAERRVAAALAEALTCQRAVSLPMRSKGRLLQVHAHPDPQAGLWVLFVPATAAERTAAELADRVRQQEAVTRLGRRALDGLPMDAFLPLVTEVVGTTLSTDYVGVAELIEDAVVTRAGGGAIDLPPRVPMSALSGTTTLTALVSGQPAHVEDYGPIDEDSPPMRHETGVSSSAAIPIVLPDGIWGVLSVLHTKAGAIGEQELLFLQQVVTLIATALERSSAQDLLQHAAVHDALTGLPNHVLLRERLEESFHRGTGRCAVLLLDLDGFKDVNDALGHAVGDHVLRQVADRLSEVVGTRGTFARLGGDEFAVLLPEHDVHEAAELARRVLAAFETPFTENYVDIALGVSVGIATSPPEAPDGSALLRHADVAMYRAKKTGTSYAVYDEELDAPQLRRLTAIAELRSAIADGQLRLHYQPVVDLRTGMPRYVEALARWQHPDIGLVPPDRFIGLAEQSRLIGPLTLWVVQEAITQAQVWRAAGLRVPRIAVNLSPHCSQDVATYALIQERLTEYADLLAVEITESALAGAEVREALTVLARQGTSCAIDDFGTGYASLAHLRRLPVDQLKIDRTFIRRLDNDPRDRAIVRSVVDLGRALDMHVVAEGVETSAIAEHLLSMGVELAQGFLWSRALEGDELAEWWSRAHESTGVES